METLILSSAGIRMRAVREGLTNYFPQLSEPLEVALVTTAANVMEHKDYVKQERQILTAMRYGVEEIDIAGKNQKQIEKKLLNKDGVFVVGGDPFYLLSEARKSGFIQTIPWLVSNGLIYFGASAGTYLACPTIESATWSGSPLNHPEIGDLSAMELVPYLIKAHVNRPRSKEGLKEGVAKARHPVRLLTDDQAFLVQNGETILVGNGPEISLSDL